MTGFDCSGLVVEGLRASGTIGPDEDLTAQELYDRFVGAPSPNAYAGALAFWARSAAHPLRVHHVEILWRCHGHNGGQWYTIGASGGGSATTTPELAAAHDAYVKVRPLRPGAWFADPFRESERWT